MTKRPQPDYQQIARLERDVFGETYEHAGAPAMRGNDLEAEIRNRYERGEAKAQIAAGLGLTSSAIRDIARSRRDGDR